MTLRGEVAYIVSPGVDLDEPGCTKNLTVNRRYLDPNRVTYEVCFFPYTGSAIEVVISSIRNAPTQLSTRPTVSLSQAVSNN
jgi:hypothetical protein